MPESDAPTGNCRILKKITGFWFSLHPFLRHRQRSPFLAMQTGQCLTTSFVTAFMPLNQLFCWRAANVPFTPGWFASWTVCTNCCCKQGGTSILSRLSPVAFWTTFSIMPCIHDLFRTTTDCYKRSCSPLLWTHTPCPLIIPAPPAPIWFPIHSFTSFLFIWFRLVLFHHHSDSTELMNYYISMLHLYLLLLLFQFRCLFTHSLHFYSFDFDWFYFITTQIQLS